MALSPLLLSQPALAESLKARGSPSFLRFSCPPSPADVGEHPVFALLVPRSVGDPAGCRPRPSVVVGAGQAAAGQAGGRRMGWRAGGPRTLGNEGATPRPPGAGLTSWRCRKLTGRRRLPREPRAWRTCLVDGRSDAGGGRGGAPPLCPRFCVAAPRPHVRNSGNRCPGPACRAETQTRGHGFTSRVQSGPRGSHVRKWEGAPRGPQQPRGAGNEGPLGLRGHRTPSRWDTESQGCGGHGWAPHPTCSGAGRGQPTLSSQCARRTTSPRWPCSMAEPLLVAENNQMSQFAPRTSEVEQRSHPFASERTPVSFELTATGWEVVLPLCRHR